jgi:vacuolar-type H+-ATPase subunit I/STV1
MQDINHFLQQVVGNLRTQATHIADLAANKQEDTRWKTEAEASIKRVQQAGNTLEGRVGHLAEEIQTENAEWRAILK